MDTTTVKPYVDALGAQKEKLEGYLTRGFQAIAIPSATDDIPTGRKDMLTTSGMWFLGLGIIALIAGLVISQTGIIVAGCAAVMSGVYMYLKGKQAMRAQAYAALGSSIMSQIKDVAANVSSQWSSFMAGQNDQLKRTVVADSDTPEAKVAMIDKIDSTPSLKVDLSDVETSITKSSAAESLAGYRNALPLARTAISRALATAGEAQQTIYSTIAR